MGAIRVNREKTIKADDPVRLRSNSRSPDLRVDTSVSQELSKTASLLEQNALKMQAEENELRAKERDNEFNTELRDILNNNDDAYYRKRGRAAVDGYDDATEQVNQLKAKYLAMATNDDEASLLSGVLSARVNSALNKMTEHNAQERRVWMDATSAATIDNSIDDAVANFNDPKYIEMSRKRALNEVHKKADRDNLGSEDRQKKVMEADTALYKSVIDRLMVEDPSGAEEYYKKIEDRIDGQTRTQIEKDLEVRVTADRGKQLYNDIISQTSDPAEQIRLAQKHKDTKVADEALTRLRQTQADNERFRQRAIEESAKSAISKVNSYSWRGSTELPVDILTPAEYDAISRRVGGIEALNNYADMQRHGRMPKTSNPETYALFTRLTDEEFVSHVEGGAVEAKRMQGELSQAHYERFMERYNGIINTEVKPTTPKKPPVETTQTQRISAFAKTAELDDKAEGLLRMYIDDETVKEKKKLGVDYLDEDQQLLIFRRAIERVPASNPSRLPFFGQDLRVFELADSEKRFSDPRALTLGDFKKTELEHARKEFKNAFKLEPDDDQLLEFIRLAAGI